LDTFSLVYSCYNNVLNVLNDSLFGTYVGLLLWDNHVVVLQFVRELSSFFWYALVLVASTVFVFFRFWRAQVSGARLVLTHARTTPLGFALGCHSPSFFSVTHPSLIVTRC
jgi:hypothetical protein